MITIIDTDVLLGFSYPQDRHYQKATTLLKKLITENSSVYLLPTSLGEFVTFATIRLGREKAQEAIQFIQTLNFLSIGITEELNQNAIQLYLQQTSKEESLFDCFVMAAANTIRADCIFSFDKGYRKNGFVLMEDFLKK